MALIHYESSIDTKILQNGTLAILGFGSQGHAHALNLKDSGYRVVVGLRPDSPRRAEAARHQLPVMTVADAVREADVVMMLLPDEHHARVFREEVAGRLAPGAMLLVAHGFSIHYGQVQPPPGIDVALIAPKGPGHLVRREYLAGRGVPALLAIHQDATGQARQRALAYAAGIGAARAGVLETTFREETETDLFGEQAVLCGGVTSLMKAGFETLVEAGYQPEMAYFECVHEMKLIVDLIYEGGFTRMRDSISNTAEYGDYLTQDLLLTPHTRQLMRRILHRIQTGQFARDWILENQAGQPAFLTRRALAQAQPLENTGRQLRAMMPWIPPGGQDGQSA